MKKLTCLMLFSLALYAANAQLVIRNLSDMPDVSKMNVKPNIIFILADDMSGKTLIPDGGPAFLGTPSINRIATEGLRFKHSFATFSLCEPSRGQMLTGYYPHITGVVTGGLAYEIPSSFTTLPQIMKANGYQTGFIGKYQIGYVDTPRPGWDYWFSFSGGIASDSNQGYYNTLCNLNGADTLITYHMTDAIAHFTTEFLNGADTSQPIFLIISEAAPHRPFQPQAQYNTLYSNQTVPFPINFVHYTINYPSYLYPDYESISDSATIIKRQKDYYELIHGMDTTAKVVFDYFTAQGSLANTMLMFASDNGVMFGEHRLKDKILAYEESIRIPFYIRYPAWFPTTGAVDSTHLALNLDWFTTILDAAGAVDTFNTHGISARYLANDSIKRNNFMYERINTPTYPFSMPDLRGVRSMQYKYIKSYCTDTVEEFFDLINDPGELTNLIFDTNYIAAVNAMRYSLDSLQLVLNDTAPIPLRPCSLMNPFYMGINSLESYAGDVTINYSDDQTLNLLFGFTVPVKSYYSLYDVTGKMIVNQKNFVPDGKNGLTIPINYMKPGMYFIKIDMNATTRTLKFVKAAH